MHPQQSPPGARGPFAPIAAAAVLSHESRPRRLVATHEAINRARLRDSHELTPPRHRQVCSGTRGTISEGERQPGALRRSHMVWDGVMPPGDVAHRLARAVRVRLPCARSTPARRPSAAAPCAHAAIEHRLALALLSIFWTCRRSATSNQESGFMVAWAIASSWPPWSPICADGLPATCSRGKGPCLRLIVTISQI